MLSDLTPEQINAIVARQTELEENILGRDEGRDYIIWSQGGYQNFWEINVWNYLGIKSGWAGAKEPVTFIKPATKIKIKDLLSPPSVNKDLNTLTENK